MGISIIISHNNDEVMDTDYIVQEIKKKWYNTRIHYILASNAPILQFNLNDNFQILGDFLGTGISYRGHTREEDAVIALWYRSIVPKEWKLQMYDSSLTFEIFDLTPETTREQILAAFSVPFDVNKHL
jgi:hypothetical protein